MAVASIIKEKFLKICIRILERELSAVPLEALNQAESEGLMSMLWDNAAFRNYIKERNAKLVYSLAGIAGSEPEPRDKARLLMGQRVENLVLGVKAKSAAARRDKALALKKEANEKKG